jgi:hypothetical protein
VTSAGTKVGGRKATDSSSTIADGTASTDGRPGRHRKKKGLAAAGLVVAAAALTGGLRRRKATKA